MLDAEGFTDAVISASNDLDETLITSLKNQGATINSWGVGTNLITSKDCPSFGGVYKLAAIMDKKTGTFIPKIKLSENEEKITNPGNKTTYRIYGKDSHKVIADIICLVGETFNEDEPLLLFDPVATWKRHSSLPEPTRCVSFRYRYSRTASVSTTPRRSWISRNTARKSSIPYGMRQNVS